VRVEVGQLRQWKAEVVVLGERSDRSAFLILEQDPSFTNDPFWLVLMPSGDTKLWSESRIEGWSGVIDGAQ
jgi:hypothetical protein